MIIKALIFMVILFLTHLILTVLKSQIFKVLSSDAETRSLESDDQATSEIPC